MGVLMSRAAAAPSATVIVCVMSALLVADRTAFAQAGSTSGTIGKQDKSISGGEDQPAPPKQRSKGPARPRNGDKKISSDDKDRGSQKVYVNPTLNGTRVDWYSGESGGWGKPAADAWCRSKGLMRSTSFAWEYHSPVIRIVTRTTCDGFCGAFTKVVCE
jgi:hypothetical protein